MFGLPAAGQQMLEESESATARRSDDLAAIGVDDRERPVVAYSFGEDRVEAVLVGGDEGGALGIAVGVEHSLDQPLVGDFAGSGELAAL